MTASDGEVIKIDFTYSSSPRLQGTIVNDEYKIRLDSIIDIGCNTISNIFDRVNVKDFVDLYFLLKEHFQFDELWENAKRKLIGLDEYWLCQALTKVKRFNQLPKMIKP